LEYGSHASNSLQSFSEKIVFDKSLVLAIAATDEVMTTL